MTQTTLERYLERLTLTMTAQEARDRATADAASAMDLLDEILAAHAEAICFENIDSFTGRSVDLDEESIASKLLGDRGGYCHEHAALLRMALRDLGIPSRPVLARVLVRPRPVPGPKTHQATLADVHGRAVLLDPGFGAGTPTRAMELTAGSTRTAPHGAFRLVRETATTDEGSLRSGSDWILQTRGPQDEDFRPLYGFEDPERASAPGPGDLDMANWYTSTRTGTLFVEHLVLARTLRSGTVQTMFDGELRTADPQGNLTKDTLASSGDLRREARTRWGVTLDEETADLIFRALPR